MRGRFGVGELYEVANKSQCTWGLAYGSIPGTRRRSISITTLERWRATVCDQRSRLCGLCLLNEL